MPQKKAASHVWRPNTGFNANHASKSCAKDRLALSAQGLPASLGKSGVKAG
jgi:hypothetical protein